MKKHIFGLMIFSLIVFAAAFVYGIYNYSETASVIETAPTIPTRFELEREMSRSPGISPTVAQAIYSVKTKKLIWQGNLPNEKVMTHFDLWAADGKDFKYLGAMRVNDKKRGDVFASDDLNASLSKIAPSVNLYLIAEADNHFVEQNFDSILKFNAQNAVPVTIDYGR